MAEDLIVGTRGILTFLIDGDGDTTGLKAHLNALMEPEVEVLKRYTYDASTGGIIKIKAPLAKPLVTLQETLQQNQRLFRDDEHPTVKQTGGVPRQVWSRTSQIQVDLWARNPVELSALLDAAVVAFRRMRREYRTDAGWLVEIGDFEDAPLESETQLYRALARGVVKTPNAEPAV